MYSIVAESSFLDLEDIHDNIVRIKDNDSVADVFFDYKLFVDHCILVSTCACWQQM